MEIFDRTLLLKRRNKIADSLTQNDFFIHNLIQESATRISLHSNHFCHALNLGSRIFNLKELAKNILTIDFLISTDISHDMLLKHHGYKIQADDELLPFKDSTFDLVTSILNIHHINDLPGTLIQIHNILKQNGIFFATFIGENSLQEMRLSFLESGLFKDMPSPLPVSPMITSKSLSELMTKIRFKDIVIDQSETVLLYNHPKDAFKDIKNLGETNCLINAIHYINRKALENYYNYYSKNFSENNKVKCTYNLISVFARK